MIERNIKPYFPLLPFEFDINYFILKEDEELTSEPTSNIDNEESNNYSEPDVDNTNTSDSCFDSKPINLEHRKKSSIDLDERAYNFKFSFYKIFTLRKKFPKKYVILIHNEICHKLKLRKATRDETRSINKYFVNFAPYSDIIILFIKNNIDTILKNIPKLKEVLK